jgi:hypothetical protein
MRDLWRRKAGRVDVRYAYPVLLPMTTDNLAMA